MEKLGRKQAIREKCIDCCGGFVREVRRCTAYTCPLWRWRMGRESELESDDCDDSIIDDDPECEVLNLD